MSISQASEMVQRSSASTPPILRRHDRRLDQEAIERLASLIQQQITPLVAVETLDEKAWAGHPRHQSESLFCDITGVSHLFGGEGRLLAAVEHLLASLGCSGRMAIADSVAAAWALSHDQRPHDQHVIAPPGDIRSAIEPLAVESLRIAPATAQTLFRLGVTHVDQLLQLPRSGLAPRLGNHLVLRIAQVLGEVDEPLVVHRAAAEHRETHLLQYPTSDQKILADRVQRLLRKLGAGLATRQHGALRMTCRLDLTAHPPLTFEIGLFAPTNDVKHLEGLIANRLESQRLPALVERLTLEVTLSGPLRSVQSSLLDDDGSGFDSLPSSVSGSQLSRLIDALSGRLGRDAVVGVKMEDNPLPEKAFTALPLAGNPSLLQKPSRQPQRDHDTSWPSPRDAMRRPHSLLANPIPLVVAFQTGGPFQHHVTSPQLPSHFRLAGVVHRMTAHWGPERIETGWWQGPSIGRDYYRIETDQGRWWWIFRKLRSKSSSPSQTPYCWMLHGRFD